MNLGELKSKIDAALERFGPEAKVVALSGYTPGSTEPTLYLDWREHRLLIDASSDDEKPPDNWQKI